MRIEPNRDACPRDVQGHINPKRRSESTFLIAPLLNIRSGYRRENSRSLVLYTSKLTFFFFFLYSFLCITCYFMQVSCCFSFLFQFSFFFLLIRLLDVKLAFIFFNVFIKLFPVLIFRYLSSFINRKPVWHKKLFTVAVCNIKLCNYEIRHSKVVNAYSIYLCVQVTLNTNSTKEQA